MLTDCTADRAVTWLMFDGMTNLMEKTILVLGWHEREGRDVTCHDMYILSCVGSLAHRRLGLPKVGAYKRHKAPSSNDRRMIVGVGPLKGEFPISSY